MTVKELIEQLQQLDPDLHVFTVGYEGGFEDVHVGEEMEIALDVHSEWWYGPHESTSNIYDIPNKSKYKIVKGIIL